MLSDVERRTASDHALPWNERDAGGTIVLKMLPCWEAEVIEHALTGASKVGTDEAWNHFGRLESLGARTR